MPLSHTARGAITLLRGPLLRINSQTANYSITAGESGTIFNNQAATGAVTFTLHAQVAGFWCIRSSVEDQDVIIAADTVDTLAAFNDIAADNIAINTSNEKVGAGVLIYSDGTNWVAMELMHDAQTAAIGT